MKKLLVLLLFIFISLNAQTLVKEKNIAPGVKYKIYMDSEKPLYICVLEADLTNEKLDVRVGLANDKIGAGGEGVSKYVERKSKAGEYIIGAVNGDFFGGEPFQAENNIVSNGKVLKGVSKYKRTLFGMDTEKKPLSGIFKYTGFLFRDSDTLFLNSFNFNKEPGVVLFDEHAAAVTQIDSGFVGYNLSGKDANNLVLGGKINPDTKFLIDKGDYVLRVPVEEAVKFKEGDNLTLEHNFNHEKNRFDCLIGGLPYLIRDGKRPDSYIGLEGLSSEKFVDLNPRTAVGYTKSGDKLYIVAVDGRNKNVSIGISLVDLADFMIGLGCYEAVNLDGGGSTAMTIHEKIVNAPSDATGERPVHDFLYLAVNGNQADYVKEFKFVNDTLLVKNGESVSPKYILFDEWGFTLHDTTIVPQYSFADGVNIEENSLKFNKVGIYSIIGTVKEAADTLTVTVK